jgi:hypothetical protein
LYTFTSLVYEAKQGKRAKTHPTSTYTYSLPGESFVLSYSQPDLVQYALPSCCIRGLSANKSRTQLWSKILDSGSLC